MAIANDNTHAQVKQIAIYLRLKVIPGKRIKDDLVEQIIKTQRNCTCSACS